MAPRPQQLAPRTCTQCPTLFTPKRSDQLYCSGACNTRAWRQRKGGTTPATPLAAPVAAPAPAPAAPPSPVTLAFSGQNVGTLAVGTAMGNLLSEGVKKLFAPAPRAATSLGDPFPTWPPAELLAAAQPAQWLADAAWPGELWLTPTTYHGHVLYLYAEAGLPYVLWQAPRGDWRLLTTPTELAQLARHRPVKSALLAIQRKYGIYVEDIALGTPLQWTIPAPPLLGL